MLQTRTGKRTAEAALKIAVDMEREGLIDKRIAIGRVDPSALDQLLHPTLDPQCAQGTDRVGLAASPGAATGEVAFTADEAEKLAADRRDVILVRTETSPEDIHGMHAARGILTARGGMTSHAAVVARGMGRPCVSGAGMIKIDVAERRDDRRQAHAQARRHHHHRWRDRLRLQGPGRTAPARTDRRFRHADGLGRFDPQAEGAHQCRHAATMRPRRASSAPRASDCAAPSTCSSTSDRIVAVRQMILADAESERKAALAKLLPMQRDDFEGIFKAMEGLPVTIRLLDPPLHEFLPHKDEEIAEVARAAGGDPAKLRARAIALHESNPMLGHRGVRLGITYPEIYEMQARAILEAALNVEAPGGKPVQLEIMIPLVAWKQELDRMKERIDAVAAAVKTERGKAPAYMVGTMIELPRAALRAGEIAKTAEFFSFGTNDLTQTTIGISRDDAGMFLTDYLNKGVIARDPFVTIDIDGVGELVRIAAERGRRRASESEARHLRRAWRRSRFDTLLSRLGTRLCLVFTIPRAGRATGGGAGGTREY